MYAPGFPPSVRSASPLQREEDPDVRRANLACAARGAVATCVGIAWVAHFGGARGWSGRRGQRGQGLRPPCPRSAILGLCARWSGPRPARPRTARRQHGGGSGGRPHGLRSWSGACTPRAAALAAAGPARPWRSRRGPCRRSRPRRQTRRGCAASACSVPGAWARRVLCLWTVQRWAGASGHNAASALQPGSAVGDEDLRRARRTPSGLRLRPRAARLSSTPRRLASAAHGLHRQQLLPVAAHAGRHRQRDVRAVQPYPHGRAVQDEPDHVLAHRTAGQGGQRALDQRSSPGGTLADGD